MAKTTKKKSEMENIKKSAIVELGASPAEIESYNELRELLEEWLWTQSTPVSLDKLDEAVLSLLREAISELEERCREKCHREGAEKRLKHAERDIASLNSESASAHRAYGDIVEKFMALESKFVALSGSHSLLLEGNLLKSANCDPERESNLIKVIPKARCDRSVSGSTRRTE